MLENFIDFTTIRRDGKEDLWHFISGAVLCDIRGGSEESGCHRIGRNAQRHGFEDENSIEHR